MKGKANFDVYLAKKKKQEFMGSKTTVSHRLARSLVLSWSPDGWKQKRKTRAGYRYVCVHLHTEQMPTCAQTNAETKDFERRHNTAECAHVCVSGQDIQTITSTPRAKPWFHHENHSNQLQMPHQPTRLNLSERFPIKEIPSLETLFFNNLLYNSSVSKTVRLRYEADTQKPSNKKRRRKVQNN